MYNPLLYHFPHVRFQHGEKVLWNPILRKEYKNLPEERVRLQFVDYLLEEANFSKNRLSFESPVHLPKDKSNSRTDVICYDTEFSPLLLVECKAPDVRLETKVALQIARYNTKIEAPYLLVTNSIHSYWFEVKNGEIISIDHFPGAFLSKNNPNHVFDYWQKRGFLGIKSHPLIRSWLVETCSALYLDRNNPSTYLGFSGSDQGLLLPNYYWVKNIANSKKIALALSSNAYGSTKLVVVLNEDGENLGCMFISLDHLATQESENAILYTRSGQKSFDLINAIDFNFEKKLTDYVEALSVLFS